MKSLPPEEQLRIIGLFVQPNADKEQICIDEGVERSEIEALHEMLTNRLSRGQFIDAKLARETGVISENGVTVAKHRKEFYPKYYRLLLENCCYLSNVRYSENGPEEFDEPILVRRSPRKEGEGVDISMFHLDTGSAFSGISTTLAKKFGLDFSKENLASYKNIYQYDVRSTVGNGQPIAGMAEFVFEGDNLKTPLAMEVPVTIFEDQKMRAILGFRDLFTVFDFEFDRVRFGRNVKCWPLDEKIVSRNPGETTVATTSKG